MKKLLYIFALGVMSAVLSVACSAAGVAGRVTTAGGNLNVRSSPSTSGAVITSVKNSSWLTVDGESGNWCRVEYADGRYGWCSADYIRRQEGSYEMLVSVTSGRLNVRKGAGTAYAVADRLEKGDRVVVLSESGGWSRVLYSGNKTGYVSSAYLKSPSAGRYGRISLQVPSYKQTDSRWRYYPIGSYGDNIGTIGCTTTALAMTESYHSGTVITPDMMAKRLSYSASGMLYWPSYCSVSDADSSYLARIYSLLKQGKPVVFGAKKSNGSQHWVTVTGYSVSSDVLSADNFTINDPGSKTRTTLSAFMKDYPNAYRIVFRK